MTTSKYTYTDNAASFTKEMRGNTLSSNAGAMSVAALDALAKHFDFDISRIDVTINMDGIEQVCIDGKRVEI